jgi:hypothetical protein
LFQKEKTGNGALSRFPVKREAGFLDREVVLLCGLALLLLERVDRVDPPVRGLLFFVREEELVFRFCAISLMGGFLRNFSKGATPGKDRIPQANYSTNGLQSCRLLTKQDRIIQIHLEIYPVLWCNGGEFFLGEGEPW